MRTLEELKADHERISDEVFALFKREWHPQLQACGNTAEFDKVIFTMVNALHPLTEHISIEVVFERDALRQRIIATNIEKGLTTE